MKRPGRPYDTRQWRDEVRPRILKRDRYRCTLMRDGQVCGRPANAVDHVIPWSEGGAWFDELNLRAACASCNTSRRNKRRAAIARRALGEAPSLPLRPPATSTKRKRTRKRAPSPSPSSTKEVVDRTW